MNYALFRKAITIAQRAALTQDKADFVVALRVAQSAVPEEPHLNRLLDSALQEFPSPNTERIIRIAADSIQLQNPEK